MARVNNTPHEWLKKFPNGKPRTYWRCLKCRKYRKNKEYRKKRAVRGTG